MKLLTDFKSVGGRGVSSPTTTVLVSALLVVSAICVAYLLVDPLPPRHFVLATGDPSSGYERFGKQYQKILARYGVQLELRNSAGALDNLQLLRNSSSGVQAALATFSVTNDDEADAFYSLGGTFDTPIFTFYRNTGPVTVFTQFRGKRLVVGTPGSAVQAMMLEAMRVTDAMDASNKLLDYNNAQAVDQLLANQVDMVTIPQPEIVSLERLLGEPDIRLMSVVQAEAIAKMVPGLKHVILWRGLMDLKRDIPNSNFDLLAFRNRLLIRKDLHPALQYLLLEAMREVHSPPGPFSVLGEFPAEQPNDLPLSPAAQAFYRYGPSLWQRYTSFWLSSLLDRFAFFGIPVFVALIPILGLALSLHRWFYTRRRGLD